MHNARNHALFMQILHFEMTLIAKEHIFIKMSQSPSLPFFQFISLSPRLAWIPTKTIFFLVSDFIWCRNMLAAVSIFPLNLNSVLILVKIFPKRKTGIECGSRLTTWFLWKIFTDFVNDSCISSATLVCGWRRKGLTRGHFFQWVGRQHLENCL